MQEDFKKTYKKEKDPKVRARMLAVHMFYVHNPDVQEIEISAAMFQPGPPMGGTL